MVTIQAGSKPITAYDTTAYAFLIDEERIFSHQLSIFANHFHPDLLHIINQQGFKGHFLETITVPFVVNGCVVLSVIVGIGDVKGKKDIALECYRRAVGHAIKQILLHQSVSIDSINYDSLSVSIALPKATLFGVSYQELAKQTAITVPMALYSFDEYVTDRTKKKMSIEKVILVTKDLYEKHVKKGITEGKSIACAVNQARYWVDSPPSSLTPSIFADQVKKRVKNVNLELTIHTEKEISDMEMGGLLAVSRGSATPCRLLTLSYRAAKKSAPTVVFVGKGVTFDSGGLSLKSSVHMETMKEDMAGAAAVIAAMELIAQYKPPVHVVGITPLTENLPGSRAVKPGDIVRFYNGKTAEIKNTDAEGRLILADALSYAVNRYDPDIIVDIATLTGACAYALGPFYSGLMSQHEFLINHIKKAAVQSGDSVWQLPMGDDYKKAIKSDVADMANIGSKTIMAGAITAAHFLQHFVHDTPWAHIDIAGTAFNVPGISYYNTGATGVGVRLLAEIALSWR